MSAGLWFASQRDRTGRVIAAQRHRRAQRAHDRRYASLRHILSAVIDGYVSIGWRDVLVAFGSSDQPFWLGLGAPASDLLIAVLVSSLPRARVPLRAWRAIHRTAHVFPLAVVHAVGIGGADSRVGWVIGCLGVGAAAVLGSTWLR
jgi:methionine sulfoxide reductase heme-binding subunit